MKIAKLIIKVEYSTTLILGLLIHFDIAGEALLKYFSQWMQGKSLHVFPLGSIWRFKMSNIHIFNLPLLAYAFSIALPDYFY